MINEQEGYPPLDKAIDIWEKGIEFRLKKTYGFDIEEEYRFHTKGVALAAKKIAEFIPSLNPEKAYIFGLLHDYGKKINEKIENKFHGKVGYEEMIKLGYKDVAQICLSHTFPEKNFNNENFSYPIEWLNWAKEKLKYIEYTDYDYLICLTDKFFEGMSIVSIEDRVLGIVKRYNINKKQIEYFINQTMKIKEYFDNKTGQDVYKIIGIK